MVQLMPLPLTVSCFSKIQIGFTFLIPAHLGSPGKGPLNGCVCVCVYRVLDGAEAMCVVRALTNSSSALPVLDGNEYSDGGLSLLSESEYDSLLQCLTCWQRLYHCNTSQHQVALTHLFCSLAVLDPRVGHTMDVLSTFISVLCHSGVAR